MTDIAKAQAFLNTFNSALVDEFSTNGRQHALALMDAYLLAFEKHGEDARNQALAALREGAINTWQASSSIYKVLGDKPANNPPAVPLAMPNLQVKATDVLVCLQEQFEVAQPGADVATAAIKAATATALLHGKAGRDALSAAAVLAYEKAPALIAVVQGIFWRHNVEYRARQFAATYTEELRFRLQGENGADARDLVTATVLATRKATQTWGTTGLEAYETAVERYGFRAMDAIEVIAGVCAETAEQLAQFEAEEGYEDYTRAEP